MKIKAMSEDEIKQTTFRVTCVNPVLDMEGGAIKLDGMNRLCGHGTGMIVEEMNENLIWKGKPYIKIPYCKYCYTKETVGVFDDTPQLVGWVINSPDDDYPNFYIEKLSDEAFEGATEYFEKKVEVRG
ncbi:hypothetical protein KKF82_07340 [Patescibacteria group bacterium]|nr:hypothetical protein [Patescibacteria group bacterium]